MVVPEDLAFESSFRSDVSPTLHYGRYIPMRIAKGICGDLDVPVGPQNGGGMGEGKRATSLNDLPERTVPQRRTTWFIYLVNDFVAQSSYHRLGPLSKLGLRCRIGQPDAMASVDN